MDDYERKIKAKIWIYPGDAAWHFITLPKKEAKEIKKKFSWVKRGWGSIPITLVLGSSRWNTSIFPDKKSGGYIFPIKKEIRRNERVSAGDIIEFTLIIENVT